eukprot:TRINITY_DN19277_c0_g1_i1.p1 TRINITY_DN19277_c0_g1~~TRINITY_DN19277_c0_g1_i1.p1  ORF type:complete len:209 (+),score=37.50 TRINITY_DN19277_c0_g1_i1:143-769(+)
MDCFFDESEHTEREFVFDNVHQRVLGWSMGGCDVTWNDLMCWYIVRHPHLFRGKSVVELGSGCGLVGLVAAHFAESVTLTDGDEAEMPLLQRNAEVHAPKKGGRVDAELLDWESEGNGRSFDVIIGQEIVYMPSCVCALAATIKRHMSSNGEAFIGNKRYATNTTPEEVKGLFVDALRQQDLAFEDVPLAFLPAEAGELISIQQHWTG